jgi:hypothetical protein
MPVRAAFLAAPLIGLLAALTVAFADDPPKAADPGTILLVDNGGKEHKLKNPKFLLGTRRLGFLVVAEGAKEPVIEAREVKAGTKAPTFRPAKDGPEALEFREEKSTNWVPGVMTLVPLERLRSIENDNEKRTTTARVAVSAKPEEDVVLSGVTRFKESNKITIEAEVDRGNMGVAAAQFRGGVLEGGFRSLRFPPPKFEAAPKGRPAVVTLDDKKIAFAVTELQALYRRPDGVERLAPIIVFKKTLKVDLAKVQKIVLVDPKELSWEVTFKDGEVQTLSLLKTVTLDGKDAELEGLIGRVPAGYKLFPAHTIGQIEFDAAEKKPEAPK